MLCWKNCRRCSAFLWWVWGPSAVYLAGGESITFLLWFQESVKKAYNPKTFCRTYMMDKQPLNTGEQKDMTEFFTDFISKLEEMPHSLVRGALGCLINGPKRGGGKGPNYLGWCSIKSLHLTLRLTFPHFPRLPSNQSDLVFSWFQKELVRILFCGEITNNVVSLVSMRAITAQGFVSFCDRKESSGEKYVALESRYINCELARRCLYR